MTDLLHREELRAMLSTSEMSQPVDLAIGIFETAYGLFGGSENRVPIAFEVDGYHFEPWCHPNGSGVNLWHIKRTDGDDLLDFRDGKAYASARGFFEHVISWALSDARCRAQADSAR